MKVRMLQFISGSRDGIEWPAVGESIDVGDDEGEQLIANGYAEVDDGTTTRSDKDAAADGDAGTGGDGGPQTAENGGDAGAAAPTGTDAVRPSKPRGRTTKSRGRTTKK